MKHAAILAVVFFTGCAVGPNYHRPALPVPPSFRAPEPLPPSKAQSLADLKWFEVFKDPQLQELIRTALAQNYDLRTRCRECRGRTGQSWPDALQPISQRRRRRQPAVRSSLARWVAAVVGGVCALAEPQLGTGSAAATLVRNRYLGPVAPRHGIRAGEPVERGGESESGGDHAGGGCRHGLLQPARARLRTRHLEAHTRNTSGIAPPDPLAAGRRCGHAARSSSGRATGLLGVGYDSRNSAADRTDGESDHAAPGKESRGHCARAELNGAGDPAGGAHRAAFRVARTTARHPRCRTEPGRGQCEHRSGQGFLLPADQP